MPGRPKAPRGCYWRGKTLWGRVFAAGREHRWSLDTNDAKVAKARRAAGQARILALKHGDTRQTFHEASDAWEAWIVHQVSPGTVTRYAVSIGQLAPYLGGKYLDEINGPLTADIIRGRRAQGVTDATIKRDLIALSSVMNFTIDQGWQESNPVLPRLGRIKERRDPIMLPRRVDIDKVITRAPGLFANMAAAALATGCRQEELADSRHSRLDRKAGRLTLVGKRNKLRVIDLAPFGGLEIFLSLPEGIANGYLFWHGNGERYSNVSSRFAGFVAEIAATDADFVPFRFHDLRHLHAVEWLRDGRSIYDLQWRLGHDSIKTTEKYLVYLTPEEVARVKGQTPGTKFGTAVIDDQKKDDANS